MPLTRAVASRWHVSGAFSLSGSCSANVRSMAFGIVYNYLYFLSSALKVSVQWKRHDAMRCPGKRMVRRVFSRVREARNLCRKLILLVYQDKENSLAFIRRLLVSQTACQMIAFGFACCALVMGASRAVARAKTALERPKRFVALVRPLRIAGKCQWIQCDKRINEHRTHRIIEIMILPWGGISAYSFIARECWRTVIAVFAGWRNVTKREAKITSTNSVRRRTPTLLELCYSLAFARLFRHLSC